MAKILVISSFSRSLTVFRGDLLRELVAEGHQVSALAPDADPGVVAELERDGIEFATYPLQRTGVDPRADWRSYRALRRIIREQAPDHVLAYTIKPVVWGCRAAAAEGVPGVHAMITGLGTTFENAGPTGRVLNAIARRLYRRALSGCRTVFFQNPDDRDVFTGLGLVTAGKTVLINGSGINIRRFAAQPLPAGPTTFLLIARLLAEKGVREFVTAARLLREAGVDCRCRIVGYFDSNPSAIREAEMQAWQDAGDVDFRGSRDDVRDELAECTVYCLPSYREGLPRTVLEAMATGRAIVTTDAPGCRETVIAGQNGFLVPVKNAAALAAAMQRYVDDPTLAARHGARSREIAVATYDVAAVNRAIITAMGLG